MLICEELFLLLTRDDGRKEGSAMRSYGVAAGGVMDLLLRERLTLSEHKDPRVGLTGTGPTGDALLDSALDRLAQKRDGRRLSSVITDSKLVPEQQIAENLAARGILSVEKGGLFGLVPARYPALDGQPEQEIRGRLRDVLSGARKPDPADATVLAVLQGLDMARKVLREESGGLSGRDLKRRIQELTAGNEAGAAVKRAVDALTAVLVSSAVVTTTAATTTTT